MCDKLSNVPLPEVVGTETRKSVVLCLPVREQRSYGLIEPQEGGAKLETP